MAKVITFSRQYPAHHPEAGEQTFFVEKIWNAHNSEFSGEKYYMGYENTLNELNENLSPTIIDEFLKSLCNRWVLGDKIHTIRAGKKWKPGDRASLRVWSGKPYSSKQIIIMPEITIKRVADIEINSMAETYIDGNYISSSAVLERLALNDGLTRDNMRYWFNKLPFSGQIIFIVNIQTPY